MNMKFQTIPTFGTEKGTAIAVTMKQIGTKKTHDYMYRRKINYYYYYYYFLSVSQKSGLMSVSQICSVSLNAVKFDLKSVTASFRTISRESVCFYPLLSLSQFGTSSDRSFWLNTDQSFTDYWTKQLVTCSKMCLIFPVDLLLSFSHEKFLKFWNTVEIVIVKYWLCLMMQNSTILGVISVVHLGAGILILKAILKLF